MTRSTNTSTAKNPVCDTSGYAIFSAGDVGTAHRMAHEMLDSHDYETGYQLLGEWLRNHAEGAGSTSQWVHIQWHMMVFELAVGQWDAARARYEEYVLPAAIDTREALVDAPAGLWRLALASEQPVDLPWNEIQPAAREALESSKGTYATLHSIMALAGAGDVTGIDAWLNERKTVDDADETFMALVRGFRAFAAGDYTEAEIELASALPNLSEVGGSRAQNELFERAHREAAARARFNGSVNEKIRSVVLSTQQHTHLSTPAF